MASQQSPNASMEQRLAAVERVLEVRAHDKGLSVDSTMEWVEEKLIAENGAKVVARAWTDPAFRARLLADGKAAIAEFGIGLPAIQRQVYVLENTPAVHNVIVCTLCSCTATTLIGPPPNWYEDLEYRARVVREARTVLQEMGCPCPPRRRSASGTRPRTRASWCCRCSRPRRSAGRRTGWPRSSRAIP